MRSAQRAALLVLLVAYVTSAFLSPLPQQSVRRLFLSESTANEDSYGDNEEPSFSDLGLNPAAMRAVKAADWEVPTPIQQLVIPKLLGSQSTSVWCEAPTGSGKTAAFGLPLLQNIQTNSLQGRAARAGISTVILLPTRELAAQIGSVLGDLANNMSRTGFNMVVLYGGTPINSQVDELNAYARKGEQIIVVATPGRFADVMDRVENPALLDKLQCLVLDEADRLLGKGFQTEMNGVLDLLPKKVPVWLFSATFPKHMVPQVDGILKRMGIPEPPLRISCANSDRNTRGDNVSSSLGKRLQRVSNGAKLEQIGPASTIDLRTIRIHKRDRTTLLRRLLEDNPEWDRVLVFVATRYSSEHVSRKLQRAGILSTELHGKQDQEDRSRRLEDFRNGKVRVLLATDLASRGIDIVGLPAVVNYDLPRSSADFVHRVGRTGRAGRSGSAVTFVTAETEAHLDLIETRHLTDPVEREVVQGLEPKEEEWREEAQLSQTSVPGSVPSEKGLAHDKMFGGLKGKRKSKKDKLRESAANEASAKRRKS
jgi:ATP-dependent RNA helicase RhlE